MYVLILQGARLSVLPQPAITLHAADLFAAVIVCQALAQHSVAEYAEAHDMTAAALWDMPICEGIYAA